MLYRPPTSKQNGLTSTLFFSEFPELLEHLAVSSGKLLLLGDFNISVYHCSDRLPLRFLNLLDSHNLVQNVSGPKHKDNHTRDLVITHTGEDTIQDVFSNNPHVSDHQAIHATFSLTRCRPPQLKGALHSAKMSWHLHFLLCHLQILHSFVISVKAKLRKIEDEHAPFKMLVVTSGPLAPWYNDEIAVEKRKH